MTHDGLHDYPPAPDKRLVALNLASGATFRPFDPDPEAIDPTDVAHALANKCRWNGHPTRFYSVADHSLRVWRLVRNWNGARSYNPALVDIELDDVNAELWALLHDAGEFVLPDVPSPLKAYCPELCEAERRILAAVAVRFDLPRSIRSDVKQADRVLMSTEARDLMRLDVTVEPYAPYKPLAEAIEPMLPAVAFRLYVSKLFQLLRERERISAHAGS